MGYLRFSKKKPQLEAGKRIYAVGDIHGCFDKFAQLLRLIEEDSADRQAAATQIVVLGDMIDRGPRSADVCQLLYGLRHSPNVVCLKGNHEQAMTESLSGDVEALRFWLTYGGAQTLLSWGVDPQLVERAMLARSARQEVLRSFQSLVPPDIARWMAELPASYRVDDYFFVHAGIRPGVALSAQKEDDLLWIREPFLSSWRKHEAVIVHGHSETDSVSNTTNRIGIDTGAYRTGRLTALGLEGEEQWIIDTAPAFPVGEPRSTPRIQLANGAFA
jgi:serine/threonine protein phosphatase 1